LLHGAARCCFCSGGLHGAASAAGDTVLHGAASAAFVCTVLLLQRGYHFPSAAAATALTGVQFYSLGTSLAATAPAGAVRFCMVLQSAASAACLCTVLLLQWGCHFPSAAAVATALVGVHSYPLSFLLTNPQN